MGTCAIVKFPTAQCMQVLFMFVGTHGKVYNALCAGEVAHICLQEIL